MADFYENISTDDVETLNRLSMLMIELRESRATLLSRYDVEDEQALLLKIESGGVAEHPAYDDYLGAVAIETTRQKIREDLKAYMAGGAPS